jgi:hypothetical protein
MIRVITFLIALAAVLFGVLWIAGIAPLYLAEHPICIGRTE